jgi:uncharacterized protein with NAD-binding domain and iron-sulfur cluster
MKKPKKVVIVGGGIAGLSAAHELVERGFDVHLYERRAYFGGKAAGVTIPDKDPAGRGGLPGEHGFRFFPGWYRHLPDTMARIKYRDRTVADNLVAAHENLFASYHREPVKALLRFPINRKEALTLPAMVDGLLGLGLTPDDLRLFMGKLWEFLTSSEERRISVYDNMTWWDFLEADKQSQVFRDYLVIAATRSTVAANPRQASAYTIAKMAIQSLLDVVNPLTSVDRVLNGPTQEVFIDPWIDYLTEQGVVFHLNAELDGIDFEGSSPAIRSLRFSRDSTAVREARTRYEMALLRYETARAQADGSAIRPNVGSRGELDDELEKVAAQILRGADPQSAQTDWQSKYHGLEAAALQKLATSRDRYYAAYADAVSKAHGASRVSVEANFFVFAIPVEQMAYQVRVSEMLRYYDPSLVNVTRLSEHVDWMAGIQFFLSRKLEITRGHIACLDSPWQLTAIEETQFWTDLDVNVDDRNDGHVKSILSVDVSAWDQKGDLFGLEAYNCTPRQIAAEVWSQLEKSLNRPGLPPVVRKQWLIGYAGKKFPPRKSYYIDDSIVERFDRKKQAVYDRSATVGFDANRLVAKQGPGRAESRVPYAYGKRLNINAEPLLISRVGSLALRPTVKTKVQNMFLAGDYVRTMTNLATMEGANESARAAVNEIILASGVNAPLCKLWPLKEPLETFRSIDALLFKRKERFQDTYADIPIRLAAGAATAATSVVAKTLEKLFDRRRQS